MQAGPGPRASGRHAQGFTLIELMVTVAVAAIVLAVAVPSLADMIRNNRLAAGSNQVVTALQLARAEAIRRGRPVSVCSSDDGASCVGSTVGWEQRQVLVFQDAASSGAPATSGSGYELIRVFPGLEDGLTLASPRAYLRFFPNGSVTPHAGSGDEEFALRPDSCTGDARRTIAVSRLGRVRTERGACA